MELIVREITAQTLRNGQQAGIIVDVGQKLKIETSPGGVEILNVGPAQGKEWTSVVVTVAIVEKDI